MSSTVAAVRGDLTRWSKRLPGIDKSAFAATAIVLAERIDDEMSSPTAVSNCARALAEILDRIVDLLPAEKTVGELDALRDARNKRRRAS